MTQRRKLLSALLVISSFLASRQVSIAQSLSIDLKTAIKTSVEQNQALRADSLGIVIQDYENKELAGWFLPQVNFSSKTNYNRKIASQMLPGSMAGQPSKDFVPVQFGTKYDMGGGIDVSQNIYRKDLLIKLRSADLQKDIAKTRYNLSKEELVYQVAAAFYSLQSKAEIIRTTTADYLNLKEILTISKSQFEQGTVKRVDFETLQINVANKQSELNQFQTEYTEQLEYFKYFLGLPESTSIVISENISFLPEVDGKQANGLQLREDIHLYHQLTQAKQVELKSTRAESLPSVSSYLRHSYQSQFNKMSKAFDNDYWFQSSSIGVTVSVSLFDGNRRKNRIRGIQAEIQQLKWQTNHQQLLAQTELNSATQSLDNNRLQYRMNAQNLALAEKVFNSRKALYAEGVSTLVELLDSEKELSQARKLYTQSLISVQTGQLDVHKANGTLLTEFIKTL